MPSGVSLMVPATQLHRTFSPSCGFSENFKSISLSIHFGQGPTSPGKRLLEKNIQRHLRAVLKNFAPLNCGAPSNRVKSPWVRETASLKVRAKLASWRRNKHYKTHSLPLQVYSSISLSFVPESHKVRILFLKKTQPVQQTPLKRKGVKSKSCTQWRAQGKNQHKVGIVNEWKWSCCAQGLSGNIAS